MVGKAALPRAHSKSWRKVAWADDDWRGIWQRKVCGGLPTGRYGDGRLTRLRNLRWLGR